MVASSFCASHLELDTYTTEDLEKHLYCATGEPQILAGFQRFVRGDPSALELPREDLCP